MPYLSVNKNCSIHNIKLEIKVLIFILLKYITDEFGLFIDLYTKYTLRIVGEKVIIQIESRSKKKIILQQCK